MRSSGFCPCQCHVSRPLKEMRGLSVYYYSGAHYPSTVSSQNYSPPRQTATANGTFDELTRACLAASCRHTAIGRPLLVTIDCGLPCGSVHWAPRSMPR